MNELFDEYGQFLGEIPEECVKDCSRPGDAYVPVLFWVNELDFNVPPALAREYLSSFGAWEDLETCNQETLNERVLWLACCEIHEEGEWLGLII